MNIFSFFDHSQPVTETTFRHIEFLLLRCFLVQLPNIFLTGSKDVFSYLGKPSSVKVGLGLEVDLFISVFREKSIS